MDCVTARDWLRTIAVTAGAALAVTGCARTQPGGVVAPSPGASASDTPMVGESPTTTPSESASTSPTAATSTSPTSTASSGPAVKATGTLKLFAPTSKKLAGTCQNKAGAPTLTVADRKNDFFHTVDAAVVLTGDKSAVSTVTIALGEDSDEITRTITYDAAKPTAGVSAKLGVKGAVYTVSGKLANAEDGTPAGTIPVTLVITCASTKW